LLTAEALASVHWYDPPHALIAERLLRYPQPSFVYAIEP
jgi:hypothetical protein